jgi:hypothetical protein
MKQTQLFSFTLSGAKVLLIFHVLLIAFELFKLDTKKSETILILKFY